MVLKRSGLAALSVFLLLASACSLTQIVGADVPRMGKDALRDRLGDATVLILDVRTGRDWTSSDRKIKGALRADPKDFDRWAGIHPRDMTLVLYCA